MRIDIFTLFPDAVEAYCSASLLGRARREGVVDVRVHDLRAGAGDARRSVDDAPFGGGAGMVLMPEPLFSAVEAVEAAEGLPRPLLLLDPGGRRFDQSVAQELSSGEGFSLLCGRYEGVDQRVADHLADGDLSVGDVVLAGGEAAALVVVEAVARLLPGVLGNAGSVEEESFAAGLLEYPQFTRPASFRGWEVPDVLRSGDHARVARWRRVEALKRTLRRRPDLVAARGGLTSEEVALLAGAGEMRLLAEHGYDVGVGPPPPSTKDAPHGPH
ncbi:MAG: tRNA (guanosine(37)-N1)-methyltransferase TrmD [Actinomycetota bacterium]|jgi:tRNA (guanine37-N1)-methyltransferase|nr:tRNA (guanosine(37)-N1)-methyltransferase TrmD [Actinomycetota bacterium]